MKNSQIAIAAVLFVVILVLGGFILYQGRVTSVDVTHTQDADSTKVATNTDMSGSQIATDTAAVADKTKTVIGKSGEGRDIMAYHFGEGEKEILFVGGIHGGYEWNTVLVANELMEYLKENPAAVPSNEKVTVIPVLNPDGLNKVVGSPDIFTQADVPKGTAATVPGRFNSNNVDLNRNFACDWQASGTWQNKTVSGGSAAFSEPESQAMKSYIEANPPTAVVVWYSAAGGVFASNCHDGVLPETKTLVSLYAKASGYKAYEEFNFYDITGDMVNWLAKIRVPAFSVLLTNHTDTEWSKNQKGIEALLQHYAR